MCPASVAESAWASSKRSATDDVLPTQVPKGMGTNCARNHPKDQSVAQVTNGSCLHSRWVKYARRGPCGARVHTAPRGWQTAARRAGPRSAVHTPIYLARQQCSLHSSSTRSTPRQATHLAHTTEVLQFACVAFELRMSFLCLSRIATCKIYSTT